jgi:hypothetical protein
MKDIATWTIVFSGFFINILPLSPVYIIFLISFSALIASLYKNKDFYYNSMMLISFVFIIYIVITQVFIERNQNNSVINVMFSLSLFIVSILALRNLTNAKIINIGRKFVRFSIYLLILESLYRISHPHTAEISFYVYKFNSIMYQDSNFVGVFIICLFFFSYYLKRYFSVNLKYEMILLVILCFLTFSRASILTLLLFGFTIILYNNWHIIPRKKYIFSFTLVSVMLLILYLSGDASLLSKFYIIDVTFVFLRETSLYNILFGVGFGNTSEYLGYGAHNFLVTYLMEAGVLGLIIMIVLLTDILRKTKYRAAIVLIPFLINGMSLAGHAIPFLFAIFSMIYFLEVNKKKDIFPPLKE